MKSSPVPSTTECNSLGRIHSLESFGTVDGPGIRLVVFFQGCPMRCLYCHNPDTWDFRKGTPMTVEEILSVYEKNRNFYKNGGITATGGEPLVQLPFLTELFEEAEKKDIHTCLDTSGILFRESNREAYRRLFSSTSLILLDLKHSMPSLHKELTGQDLSPVLQFLKLTRECHVPVILRHVLVKGWTDQEAQLDGIGKIIAMHENIRGLEVLPYHGMGEKKYQDLGIPYPLKGMEDFPKEDAAKARRLILESIRKYRAD